MGSPKGPQAQSRLLSLSPELRHAIWTLVVGQQLHLVACRGYLRLSACLAPRSSSFDDGYERRTTGDVDTDAVWARRLQSLWGEHWACEEFTGGEMPRNRDRAALMATSRQVCVFHCCCW